MAATYTVYAAGDMLPNAKVASPIDHTTFDSTPFCKQPANIDALNIPVSERHRLNIPIEAENALSRTQTDVCMRNPTAGHDMGKPLQAIYAYSTEELSMLASSKEYAASFVALPHLIHEHITIARMQAEKDDKDEKKKRQDAKDAQELVIPLEGSMTAPTAVTYDALGNAIVNIPDAYCLALRSRQVPPLNFWTNEFLHEIALNPSILKTRPFTMPGNKHSDTIFDIDKMTQKSGSDTDHTCVLSVHEFFCALRNLHRATQKLSAAPNPAIPDQYIYGVEFGKHVKFLESMPYPTLSMPLWYTWEREQRHRLLVNMQPFLLSMYRDKASYFNELFRIQKTQLERDFFAQKRPLPSSAPDNPRPQKQSRGASAPPPSSVAQSFRPSTTTDGRVNTPYCITCGGDHSFYAHPEADTNDASGKPCHTVKRKTECRRAQGADSANPVKVCIGYNLRKCQGRHGSDYVDECSRCGGKHAALDHESATHA